MVLVSLKSGSKVYLELLHIHQKKIRPTILMEGKGVPSVHEKRALNKKNKIREKIPPTCRGRPGVPGVHQGVHMGL